ncbi:uncharacterized protein LOC135494310 [Lineus longissimus]|uniref:uncharacterized protein LOC135494310 n=1 Tax=Lineus longissimus TaxID=88925 RepID=UPI00315DFB6F
MVHLELTHRLTTDEFLQAFRRMVNRRGICNTMWSDNARTFKSAGSFIKKVFVRANSIKETELDTDALTTQLAAKGIEWKFIVERAPWRGGWWERLVRSVKESLRRALGKALLRYTELYTVLTDVEAAINSRPLTTISDDSRDLEPLTPAHLALGRPLMGIPDVAEETWEAADTIVTQRYLYRQKLANHFWKRWQNEYLPSLTVRKKWETEKPPVEVGSIVLISEDRTPRGSWLLGRVDEVYMGKDGICRTVAVRTKKGVLKRPIQRLHHLEAVAGGKADLSSETGSSSTPNPCYVSDLRSSVENEKNAPDESTGRDSEDTCTDDNENMDNAIMRNPHGGKDFANNSVG